MVNTARIRRSLRWFLFGISLVLFPALPSLAQVWQTAANNPGDETYYQPPYPVAFVAATINEIPNGSGVKGHYHIGTDVLSANNPDQGNHLWMLLPNGAVKKLFPLDIHEQTPGLINTPQGQLWKSAVVEPNISENGRKLYFAYFHDATFTPISGSELDRISYKGSDLYVLDLGPLIDDQSIDPATLDVTRLTFHEYQANGKPTEADKNKNAMNQTLASSTGPNDWGTVYMHATEMRTHQGLKLVYVTDEERVLNSNAAMAKANHNFNIHIADIATDGTIKNPRQFQYYTTTSALSPHRMRDGIAFSYQSSTAAARNWHQQGIRSDGYWYPLLGYGINPELIHLGTFCVKTTGADPGDYFVGVRYYNANNEGFGSLWRQDLSKAGINTYDNQTQWGIIPKQYGAVKISTGVKSSDYPSDKDEATGQYIGKITSPRCGRPDELYMAYTPTSANGRLNDSEGNKNIYHSYIAYRPNLEQFYPLDQVNAATGAGLRIVINDSSDTYTLVWPVPVMSWLERTGDLQQQYSPSIIDPASSIKAGLPYAQIGTSDLANTDRKPFDCWLGPGWAPMQPYSPNKPWQNINQENDLIVNNTDGLTYIQNQNNFCEPLHASTVLGISVQVTSNKTDLNASWKQGYTTDGNGKKEAAKILGVFDTRDQSDQSFMSVIPAHTPFEFHLLHRDYGLKLTDVRSWHSLQPRETRNDCGGCHQHEKDAPSVPFQGTIADNQAPLDMTNGTPFLRYNRWCQPVMRWSRKPTKRIPEWTQDIWPKFDQHCGSCHNSGTSTDALALAALDYVGEQDAYNKLKNRNYANSKVGALGSPAFWAARGQRTDGRNNDLDKYQPDSSQWGYRFSSIHATDPGLCSLGNGPTAKWVYELGLWIDNHMPRDTGNSYSYHHDWYHPTVDGAISTKSCTPNKLRVGYRDDTGLLAEIRVLLNEVEIAQYTNTRNGAQIVSLPATNDEDSIKVIVLDHAENRQMYEKSVGQLVAECIPTGSGGPIQVDPRGAIQASSDPLPIAR